jgi:hypothetical protein
VNLGSPINLAGFNDGAPALSADGNTMFFYSNRPGSFGANDLYMSTRLPLVADHFTLSAPANTTAGQSVPLTLTAWDHYGNIATGYTGTVNFVSSDRQATLPASYTFTAADNGMHTFGAALLTAGTQSIKATDPTGVIIGSQAGIVVNSAPAVALFINAPTSVSAGVAFTVRLSAMDPYGNVDTNYTGTTTWTSSDTDPGVVLPADYTFQANDNGTHTFTAAATLITPGAQTLTATDTASGVTSRVIVTVAPVPPAPPGAVAHKPWVPRLDAALSLAQGVQPTHQVTSLDRLVASFEEEDAGLLLLSRQHKGAADELFARDARTRVE